MGQKVNRRALPISWRMWQWKNLENRPIFDEVMCRLRRLTVLAHPYIDLYAVLMTSIQILSPITAPVRWLGEPWYEGRQPLAAVLNHLKMCSHFVFSTPLLSQIIINFNINFAHILSRKSSNTRLDDCPYHLFSGLLTLLIFTHYVTLVCCECDFQ